MNQVINNMNEDTVLVTAYLVIVNKKTLQLMGTSLTQDTLKLNDQNWMFSSGKIATDQTFSQ